jgi:plasmid stabilization system protein ParE
MDQKKKKTDAACQIKLSATAIQHLDEITGYIAFINQQPLNAVKIGDAFFDTLERIALNPTSFRECEELPTLSKMYRRATFHNWNIIYRINKKEVLILGIIHQSRRPGIIRKLRKI